MSCNCKNDKTLEKISNNDEINNKKTTQNIGNYSLRFLGFLITMLLLPIINVLIIWFIFRTLVLDKDVNMKEIMTFIANKIKKPDYDDEDDDDFDSLTEDDVVMVDVEDITNNSK